MLETVLKNCIYELSKEGGVSKGPYCSYQGISYMLPISVLIWFLKRLHSSFSVLAMMPVDWKDFGTSLTS